MMTKKESVDFEGEVKQRVITYVVGAFGLVAGLAWNDAIKTLIEYFFPASQDTLLIKFGYALGVTVMVAVVAVYLMRFANKKVE